MVSNRCSEVVPDPDARSRRFSPSSRSSVSHPAWPEGSAFWYVQITSTWDVFRELPGSEIVASGRETVLNTFQGDHGPNSGKSPLVLTRHWISSETPKAGRTKNSSVVPVCRHGEGAELSV